MKKQILILVSLLLILISNNVVSQTVVNGWKKSIFEGDINTLHGVYNVNDSTTLGINFDNYSKLYKSINNGETWNTYNNTIPSFNFKIFNYNDTLYATGKTGIISNSLDMGETWNVLDTVSDSDINYIYIEDNLHIIINKYGMIYVKNSTYSDTYTLTDTIEIDEGNSGVIEVYDIYVNGDNVKVLANAKNTTSYDMYLYESNDQGNTFINSNIFNGVRGDVKFYNDTNINIVYVKDGKFTKNSFINEHWTITNQTEVIIQNDAIEIFITDNSFAFSSSSNTVFKIDKDFNSLLKYSNKFTLLNIDNSEQYLLKANITNDTIFYTKNGGFDLIINELNDFDLFCNTSDSIKLNYQYIGLNEFSITTDQEICYIKDSILFISEAIDATCIITYTDGFIETKDTFNISIKSPVNTKICIIANNPETNNNVIIIEQSDNIFNNYNIYKEVQGEYNIIGTINYGEESIFIDPETPNYPDYYKVSISDNCGNETETSDYHKTLFLQANLGTSGEHNLDWSSYEGIEDIKYQIIYGGTEQTTMEPIDTIYNSSTNKYTNLNPENNTMYYQIGIVKESNCNYEFTNTKSGTINYTQSVSNILEYIETGVSIKTNDMLRINISPNPAINQIKINLPSTILYNIPTSIKIYSTSGQIVYNKTTYNSEELINIESLHSGLYLITVENEEGIGNTKLIKK